MSTVGKKIGNNVYIHKSALSSLSKEEQKLVRLKSQYIPTDFNYVILKINIKENSVSFIESDDWNTSDEPIVGNSIKVTISNTLTFTKSTNLIYHHKWMFVLDSYTGFNVLTSKKRSEYWENHPEILKLKCDPNERFKNKIGSKKYWEEKVLIHL